MESKPTAEPKEVRFTLVGREEHKATMRQLLGQAKSGRGALVMIGGEAGVGKPRLCESLIAEGKARGFAATMGDCYELEGGFPYTPFVRRGS